VIFGLWLVLLLVFVGVPSIYYLYLERASSKDWNLKIENTYLPTVTIIVPMYNEEKTIRLKLENLAKLEYSKEKLQILLVNDASTDATLNEISSFLKNASINFRVINLTSRNGKTKALNEALKYASGEIVIVSDADAFLSPNILHKAMPFFADPSIGAVISREELLQPNISWVSETESLYFDIVYGTIKLGESKIHATIMFHGGFAAYRKSLLDIFNIETDDTGTALDIVQKGSRTIMVPEAVSFCLEFVAWKDKFKIKVRRATHNIKTWVRCLLLLFKSKLLLPKRIAVPEIFLYLFNPLVLLAFSIVTVFLSLQSPFLIALVLLVLSSMLIVKQTRTLFIEVVQNNCILLIAILSLLVGKEIIYWKTMQDPRAKIRREILENMRLV
jgi:cellulose synthase/poly-beta-1,6-N-acetylglucosamine synthase-like glycosyltransferase